MSLVVRAAAVLLGAACWTGEAAPVLAAGSSAAGSAAGEAAVPPRAAACAACHGTDGKGNKALGAPNLTDDVWLHGWGENAIVAMINNGKNNQMPAQASKLTEGQIHVLASYVWGLSNVKPAAGK